MPLNPGVEMAEMASEGKKVPAKYKCVLVHMRIDEAEILDKQQGGPSFDENTGLREYSKLAEVYDNDHIKEIGLLAQAEYSAGKPSEEIQALYEKGAQGNQAFEPAPEDSDPEVSEIEHEGRGGDTLLVWLPKNMVIYFGKLRGGLTENPETGLFEFGGWREVERGFKNIVTAPARGISGLGRALTGNKNFGNELTRALYTVGGFMTGGPLGAGLGNAWGSWATGKSFKDSMIGGLKNGLGAWGAQNLAGMGAPAASGAGAPIQMGTNPTLHATPAAAMKAAGYKSAAPGVGSLMGNLVSGGAKLMSSPAAGVLLHHGLSAMADKREYEQELRQHERDEAERERRLREAGYYRTSEEPEARKLVMNPKMKKRSKEDVLSGRFDEPVMVLERARGGNVKAKPVDVAAHHLSKLVKGPGKGQDDSIRTAVPSNSYIVDATSTANAGDGSSEAGGAVIQEYLNKMVKKHGKKLGDHTHPKGEVPVYLSKDEYVALPHEVAAVGMEFGHPSKGPQVLKSIVKSMRKHKSSNGDRLPPKAKSLETYAKSMRR